MSKKPIQWTDEQKRAIYTRDKNILVSASAGSGKTTVMIERIVQLLKEGAQLNDMLICTFTRAAAADMKEKLADSLASDDSIKDKLSQLGTAQISTLHSFCQRLICLYFYEVGVAPDFEIAEEYVVANIRKKCADKLIAAEENEQKEDFLRLNDVFGGRKSKLNNLIFELHDFAAMQPEENWLEIDSARGDEYYSEQLSRHISGEWEKLLGKLLDLRLRCEQAGFERNIRYIDEIVEAGVSDVALSVPRGKIDPLFAPLNDEFKTLKEKHKKLRELSFAAKDAAPESTELRDTLVRLTLRFGELFAEEKRAANCMDFADLEHYALKILRSPSGDAIRARFKYVFVDECQDINPLQDRIISELNGGKSLFLVGDLKQSIYAFRGCEPQLFADKFRAFSAAEDCEVIELNRNYRSRDNILGFVNDVFRRVMREDFGSVDYEQNGKFALRGEAGGEVYVHCVEKRAAEPKEVYSVKDESFADEQGEACARLIVELLKGSIEDKGEIRPVLSRDIAVLVRGENAAAWTLNARLNKLGIKTAVYIGGGNVKSLAVKQLSDYLRLIDNARDDEALACSMLSLIGGFDERELGDIRRADLSARNFYEAVGSYQGELRGKIDAFYEELAYFRERSRMVPPAELAGEITAKHSLFIYAFAEGEESAEELDAFLDKIKSFGGGLDEFLRAVEDCAPKTPLPSDALPIMTVHAAKGLEFPFVVLLNAGKTFNSDDLKNAVLKSRSYGVSVKNYDFDSRKINPSAHWLLNREIIKKRIREEELRLLYVALTRAKLRLDIFTASASSKSEEDASSWYGWISAVKPGEPCSVEDCVTDTPDRVPPPPDTATAELLREYYAVKPQTYNAPVKTGATYLAQNAEEENVIYLPGAGEDAAERGTAYHRVMEFIDFAADFESEWGRVTAAGLAAGVDESTIRRAAEAMRGLCDGAKVYKEQPFVFKTAAAPYGYDGGEMLVQGVIDLLIIKDGNAIVVDYKTGSISSKYKTQLSVYAAAVKRILGLDSRCYIYSFVTGELLDADKL